MKKLLSIIFIILFLLSGVLKADNQSVDYIFIKEGSVRKFRYGSGNATSYHRISNVRRSPSKIEYDEEMKVSGIGTINNISYKYDIDLKILFITESSSVMGGRKRCWLYKKLVFPLGVGKKWETDAGGGGDEIYKVTKKMSLTLPNKLRFDDVFELKKSAKGLTDMVFFEYYDKKWGYIGYKVLGEGMKAANWMEYLLELPKEK